MDELILKIDKLVTVLSINLPRAAGEGAQGIEDELGDIDPPTIIVPYRYEPENDLPEGSSYDGGGAPAAAGASAPYAGPTIHPATSVAGAMVGFRVNVNVDGERIAEASARHMGRMLAPFGAGVA
jgi:hypothetical protein